MSNNKKNKLNNIFYMEPMLYEKLTSSMSGITSMLESYQNAINRISITPAMENLFESYNQFAQSITSAFDDSAYKNALTVMMDLNVSPILEMYKTPSAFTSMVERLNKSFTISMPKISEEYIQAFSKYEKLFSQIEIFSENEIEIMLDGTEFSREELYEDIEQLKYELSDFSNIDSISEDLLPEEKFNEFLKKHSALAHILCVIEIILFVISGAQDINNGVVPIVQDTIVALQSNEDIYFIKIETAKLYLEPSSHSTVIMNILYGEQVTLIESDKLWDKVTYITSEGEEVVGWIAKRNLLSYRDYLFNSNELYDID